MTGLLGILKEHIVPLLPKIATFLVSSIAIIVLFLKFSFDKKLKTHSLKTEDLLYLNTHLSDRLVEAELLITEKKPPTADLKRRFKYSSSRVAKYKPALSRNINKFLTLWETSIEQITNNHLTEKEYSRSVSKLSKLIKKMHRQSNALLK